MFSLEQIKNDISTLVSRKEQAMNNFHQILGAISVLEQIAEKFVEPESENKNDGESNDENDHGSAE